ncbi:hypothetical protein CG740_34870 [Streptomyces sp. CB01201]|uniref:hypothetical protein n=1 Tax=Streptomyces sp. CB01201 TaxID=2020324 RepID=UPI000C26E4FD|nr:hypothetical protein [Streptomyces sp. CB01201]PJM98622.1 hypothetical protein CG740_34870 [Streptomyces sp. CB01201]
MGDYVGVDPVEVRKLADRLGDLEQALAKHGALIRKNFTSWHSGLDLSLIAQQTRAVGDDFRDMSKRADLARTLEEAGGAVFLCTPQGDIIGIPWDMKDVSAQSPKEAQQEAAILKKALDDPKSETSREDIQAIARSLADHQDDPAYMTAFMIAGGITDATRVPSILHEQDGTHNGALFSPQSEKILAQYGKATQVMSDLAVKGNYPHPAPNYLAALTNPPNGDMWSVGVLFKYGPKGDLWNPKALSDVGGAMLDWRAKQSGRNGMRPDYMPRIGNSGMYGYYTSPGVHNWYQSLGLDPQYTDPDAGSRLISAIQANDPALALMNRIGENAQASRDLLTASEGAGLRNARQLVDYHWEIPGPKGPIDESDAVFRVLTLAANDRSPGHVDQSGQAASNILIAAAKEEDIFSKRDEADKKEQFQTYPKGTAVALAGITGTWADQLGATSVLAGPDSHGYSRHVLGSNPKELVNVMKLFARNNADAAAMFDTTLHTQVSEAAGSAHATNDLTNMGSLAGLFTKAKLSATYTEAQQLDEEHKHNMMVLNYAGNIFGWIPAVSAPEGETLQGAAKLAAKGLKYSQNLVTVGRTIIAPDNDPFFTGNAGKQEALNQEEAKQQYLTFSPAIAQGLIRAGKIPAPANAPWYDPQTKTIAPNAWNNGDFNNWSSTQDDRATYINAFQTGFDHTEVSPDGK